MQQQIIDFKMFADASYEASDDFVSVVRSIVDNDLPNSNKIYVCIIRCSGYKIALVQKYSHISHASVFAFGYGLTLPLYFVKAQNIWGNVVELS